MDLEKYYLENSDEIEVIKPPYWVITYLDMENKKHLAMIKDINYLNYLKMNFIVLTIEEKVA